MSDDEIPYRNPPPPWRTQAMGIWTDILNDWQASFETSNRGNTALGVFIQDQTTPVLTVPFLQARAAVELAADTEIDSRTIELATGHNTDFGDIIELAEVATTNFMQSRVIDPLGLAAIGDPVTGDTITLDSPVNRVYTVSGSIALRSTKSMLADGRMVSQGGPGPQVFSILPLPDQAGDMVRVIIELRGAVGGTMDFTSFGSEPELLNGVVVRVKNSDGTFRNLFNFKSNSDFIEQGFDHAFLDPKGGNTVPGFTSRVTWGGQSKHGVVIRLDGALDEELQIIIQDDLRNGNTRFHLTAQGHELQED
jgi:hypothetical protein